MERLICHLEKKIDREEVIVGGIGRGTRGGSCNTLIFTRK
jgi:hypothetical protein